MAVMKMLLSAGLPGFDQSLFSCAETVSSELLTAVGRPKHQSMSPQSWGIIRTYIQFINLSISYI